MNFNCSISRIVVCIHVRVCAYISRQFPYREFLSVMEMKYLLCTERIIQNKVGATVYLINEMM